MEIAPIAIHRFDNLSMNRRYRDSCDATHASSHAIARYCDSMRLDRALAGTWLELPPQNAALVSESHIQGDVMTKLVLALAVPLAACAGGGFHVDVDGAPRAKPRLDLGALAAAATDNVAWVNRTPLDLDMPNTGRLTNQIRAVLGANAVTEIKICI